MKGVIIHALLAVFGLGFAFQTWTRTPEEDNSAGRVEVVDCGADALQKLSLKTPSLEVQVEPQRDETRAGELKYWITTRHIEKEAAKADPATPEAPTPAPDAQRPKRFLANAAFNDYLKRLRPLRAARSLGKLDAKQDADFGFDKATTSLQLECAGKPMTFDAGARAFGATQRYVRDNKSQSTYLFDDQVIADLESAQFKFMQADLHDFKPDDVDEATVVATALQGASKHLLHRDRKVANQAQWVDSAAPDKRNELYNNWFARLGRLRARAYLATGAEPGSDLKSASGITPVLNIDYKVADRPAAKFELVRVLEDENGVGHYYARTETTRAWVALYDSAAKEVEQDIGMVVGVEQPAAKPEGSGKAAADSSKHGAPMNPMNPAFNPHAMPAGHPPHGGPAH